MISPVYPFHCGVCGRDNVRLFRPFGIQFDASDVRCNKHLESTGWIRPLVTDGSGNLTSLEHRVVRERGADGKWQSADMNDRWDAWARLPDADMQGPIFDMVRDTWIGKATFIDLGKRLAEAMLNEPEAWRSDLDPEVRRARYTLRKAKDYYLRWRAAVDAENWLSAAVAADHSMLFC